MSDANSQRVLAAIHAASEGRAGAAVTIGQLADATVLGRKALNNAVQRLSRRQFIEIDKPGHYRLTEAGADWIASGRAIAGGQGRRFIRRTKGLTARAWWLMRQLNHFTLHDLLHTLVSNEERAADRTLRRYVSALERSGVLVRMKRRAACPTVPDGLVIWRLVKDLGREAPVFRQRHNTVFDPNSGQVIPWQEENHECA